MNLREEAIEVLGQELPGCDPYWECYINDPIDHSVAFDALLDWFDTNAMNLARALTTDTDTIYYATIRAAVAVLRAPNP